MSDTALEAVIREHCRELKLAAFVREYPALCRRARDDGRPYEEFLRELLEAEVTSRRQSTARRLLHEARFPDVKTLDQFDWPALKGGVETQGSRAGELPVHHTRRGGNHRRSHRHRQNDARNCAGRRSHAPALSGAFHPRR